MPFGQLASAVNALNGNLAAGWDAFTGNSGQSFSDPGVIVLDYQEVGSLGIIDYSNQANDATHYSGRGATMDAATNTITYPTGYGTAERTATVWMRVSTLGARTLNGASGTFTFTPTATGAWEQLNSTATVSGNLSWTAGSDCDIADLQIGTAHWPHADWSDPTASGLNGKIIADVGPDDFHGVCTGCNGFTKEGIDPDVAGIVGLDSALWFNGVDTFITTATKVFHQTADFDETFEIYVGNLTAPASYLYYINQQDGTNIVGLAISPTSGLITFWVGGSVPIIESATPHYGEHITVRLTRVGTAFEMLINGVSQGTHDPGYTRWINPVPAVFGKHNITSGREITGLIQGDSVTGTLSGTFLTVGQKRATIPQTGNRNWNKYRWFNGVDTFITTATPVFPATADFDETFEIYVGNLTAPASYLYYMSQVESLNTFGLAISPTSGLIVFIVGGPVVIESATPHYGEHITVRLTRVGTTFEMLINGVSQGTHVSNNSISQEVTVFGKASFVSGREITGLIYGDSVSGTESGTFARQLALASDANEQVDAYGAAILEPRLNNQIFNGFGDGEKWTTPDATSLDAVKTFIGFVFYDGINDTTWLDLTAADTIIINASSGSLASSGITSPTYYTNGAAGTALNTGWNHIMLTTETAVNCGPIDGENRNGSIQFYTDVKFAAFALEEYNFNKSNYGL